MDTKRGLAFCLIFTLTLASGYVILNHTDSLSEYVEGYEEGAMASLADKPEIPFALAMKQDYSKDRKEGIIDGFVDNVTIKQFEWELEKKCDYCKAQEKVLQNESK